MSFESLNGKNALVALGGGLDIWVTITAYTEGDIVTPITANGHSYIVASGDDGTSDVAEPTFPTDPGGTVVDGTVTWTEQGIDADKILGMGAVSVSGGSVAEIDDTEFCDEFSSIRRGIKTGHNISFSGNKKLDDTNGQDAILLAYYNETDLTDLRIYPGTPTDGLCGYSYYAPNDSLVAGGGLPANMPISHIKLMSEPTFTIDKGDLTKTEFTGKVQSVMRFFEFT